MHVGTGTFFQNFGNARPGAVEQMIENNRRIGGAGVIGIFSYGSMPLFAEKVLPRLKGHGAGATRSA